MRSRLLPVAGVVVAVVVVSFLGLPRVLGGPWPPEPVDPNNVVVWGETWTYSEYARNWGVDHVLDIVETERRAPAYRVILIPVSDIDILLDPDIRLASVDWIPDYEADPGTRERLMGLLFEAESGEPVKVGYFRQTLAVVGVSSVEARRYGWATASFDENSGRYSLEVAPGNYLLCLMEPESHVDSEHPRFGCLGQSVELLEDTPIYFTAPATEGSNFDMWTGRFHIGTEAAGAVQDAIDNDELLVRPRDPHNENVYRDFD